MADLDLAAIKAALAAVPFKLPLRKEYCGHFWRLVSAASPRHVVACELTSDEADYIILAVNSLAALVAEVEAWRSVFGHLSADADTAGNMIFEKHREMLARVEELEAERLSIVDKEGREVGGVAFSRDGMKVVEILTKRVEELEGALQRAVDYDQMNVDEYNRKYGTDDDYVPQARVALQSSRAEEEGK